MRTSRDSWLTKPEGDAKISQGIFGYLTARVRQRAYDIVVREFKKSGLTQKQLASRWGKDPAIVSRFFARPGNWELDTYTEALFAISGGIPNFSVVYLNEAKEDQEDASSTISSNVYRLTRKESPPNTASNFAQLSLKSASA